MSLSFDVEWLDAPGINDAVQAASWGRLSINLTGREGSRTCLTQCLDLNLSQAREAVYGSWFSLARWLVDPYWFVLYEPPRTGSKLSGRELGRQQELRSWVQRHNLLAAREGGALPDLSIAREEDSVSILAHPDPVSPPNSRVRFVCQGTQVIQVRDCELGIQRFVDAVLERLRNVKHPDVDLLARDWEQIRLLDDGDRKLCDWAARLGVDAQDPCEAPDDFLDTLGRAVGGLPEELGIDLLDSGIQPAEFSNCAEWVTAHSSGLHSEIVANASKRSTDGSLPAFEVGYRQAGALRELLGAPAGATCDDKEVARNTGVVYPGNPTAEPLPARSLEALIGICEATGAPVLIDSGGGQTTRRFRWARAVYLAFTRRIGSSPRLLTASRTRVQRESRAFAAELLAPHAAIRERIDGIVPQSQLEALAAEFQVSETVVRYQIENHELAIVE